MGNEKIVGVIDEPIAEKKYDALKLELHSSSLVEFIEDTTTPMTIGIQGEWGSGKTSLLNSIKAQLSNNDRYKQIWINSWENALLTSAEETLIKIINAIIEELIESDKDITRKEKILSAASSVFKGAMRVGAAATVGTEAGDQIANEFLGKDNNGIKNLKSQLKELALNIQKRPSNPYEKIIIYVDDLDRIEPREAVKILELLKNIFSITGCVFILAIDYQVVVKGLEHKFGKQTPENEWEFRAFFDKIIQLPFMMPMGQYDIGNYVTSLLIDIGFIEKDSIDTQDIKEIVLLTIGGNPRSIKRLVNSVSLIQIFTKHKNKLQDENTLKASEKNIKDKKFLLFSLLCLQIAYPAVYSLLIEQPDFLKWDDDFAFSHTNKEEEKEKELFEKEFENAKASADFDEIWEQSLYKICYIRPRLKPKVTSISRFLSFINEKYTDNTNDETLGALLAEVLAQASVTSVTSTDQPQNTNFKDAPWKSADQKASANKFWNLVLDAIQDKTEVYSRGRRTGSSGVVRLTEKDIGKEVIFGMSTGPELYIYISYSPEEKEKGQLLMKNLMVLSSNIESDIGAKLDWIPTPRRAQYIKLHYTNIEGLPKLHKFGTEEEIIEEDLHNMVNFFDKYAEKFEKTMKKYISEEIKKIS